jgi:hypothetical protein
MTESFYASVVSTTSQIMYSCELIDNLIANIPADKKPVGRELALVKTKLQEAYMWASEASERL